MCVLFCAETAVFKMDTKHFLQKILPKEGFKHVMFTNGQHPKSLWFSDFDEMAVAIAEKEVAGFEVYHACSGFKSTESRKASNVRSVKAFWLDLGVGEDKAAKGDGYASQSDAYNALKTFCKAYGFPKPMVVISGYGLHVYWPLEQSIEPDAWLETATKFKKLLSGATPPLLADPSRTADLSSLLRPTGTVNKKRGGCAQVSLFQDCELVDFSAFKQIIDDAQALPVAHPDIAELLKMNAILSSSSATGDSNPSLSDTEEMLRYCDPRPYEFWRNVGFVLADRFGPDGYELYLNWSRGDLWKGAKP